MASRMLSLKGRPWGQVLSQGCPSRGLKSLHCFPEAQRKETKPQGNKEVCRTGGRQNRENTIPFLQNAIIKRQELRHHFCALLWEGQTAETYRKDKRIERFKEFGERTNDTEHSVGVTVGNETWTALVATLKETGKPGFLSFLLVCEVRCSPAVLETRHRSTVDSF